MGEPAADPARFTQIDVPGNGEERQLRERTTMALSAAPWPLVGRDDEVASLAASLVDGRGATLTGDAGIGKTRLANAVLDRLELDGWSTATFEAGPAGGAVPFLPFVSLLRGSAAQDDLQRIVHATAALVDRAERVAVLVDDAHALDDMSLAFLSHLVATTDVRLLVTVRTSADASRLARAWADVLARVEVTPLVRSAVDELVHVGLGQVDPSAMRWIWDTTQGNPLFVRELVTDAVDRGALVERGGTWSLGAEPRPPGRRLRDVVSDRFGSLWDAERDAVELLAIAEPMGVRLFEKVASPEVVQELEHRGLITSERSGRRVNVRLAHRIHGEVVREQLGPSTVDFHRRRLLEATSSIGERRRSDRLRAALWRVELGDASDPDGLVLAAEDLMTVMDGASVAGARQREGGDATGREMLEQVVTLGRAALDAGAGLRAAALVIPALNRLGRHDEARAVRASLDVLVADETDHVLVAKLLSEIDGLVLGNPAEADARLRDVESMVSAPDLVRSLRASRVTTALALGQHRRGYDLAQLVLDDPDVSHDDRVRCMTGTAVALAHLGRTEECIEIVDRAAAMAAAAGDGGRSVGGVLPRIAALATAGRFDELDQLLGLCHMLSEQRGYMDGVAIFSGAMANAALLRGRPRTALQRAADAMAHAGGLDPMGVRHLALAVRSEASVLLGDVESATAAIRALDELPASSGFEHEVVRARAWYLVAQHDVDGAVALLLAGSEGAFERGHVVGAVALLHDVARLGCAERAVGRIVGMVDGVDGALMPAQAAHVLALAADDATGLEDAADRLSTIGAHLAAAEACAHAAASHRRAGRHGRSGAAAAHSHELLASCEGATTPSLGDAEPLHALTKREREIVVLAAEGCSNKEIADRLVVSVRTVHTHLYNAFAKLGVESRDDLSAVIAPY